jgi:hypothetical protein
MDSILQIKTFTMETIVQDIKEKPLSFDKDDKVTLM